jgi:RNA polymerase sigma factor (sigma-70 family)
LRLPGKGAIVDDQDTQQRLSRIQTHWSDLVKAHHGTGQEITEAQQTLLVRYRGAIYRYLLAAVRNTHVAEELCQEFALQFIQGDFKRVDPQRGRFRDYVKTVLFHLVANWGRKQAHLPRNISSATMEPVDEASPSADSEREFLDGWRDELLAKTWDALKRIEEQTGQLYYTMLQFKVQNQVKSEAMAQQLGAQLGKTLTAVSVRQTIHRAREKFGDLLLEEVASSLETTDVARLEQELIDLGLLVYCQDALNKRKG